MPEVNLSPEKLKGKTSSSVATAQVISLLTILKQPTATPMW
ncbi:MAG: hypothetical protein JWQ49_6701 [Edaphobacter sp.]|nr:hypothetical protein [Edaphobacter sp.]